MVGPGRPELASISSPQWAPASISSPANPLSGCPYPAPAQSGQREKTKPTNPPTLKMAKMLLLLALLVTCAAGLPQKVVFRELGREGSEEGCPRRDMIHWSDGQCFTVGEQGPCGEGGLLDRTGGCVTTTQATTATDTTTDINTIADVSNETATNELGCSEDQIPFEGGCYQLATTGPCQPGHWLLLVEVVDKQNVDKQVVDKQVVDKQEVDKQVVAECKPRKCPEEEVWWTKTCSCLGRASVRSSNPCGENGELMVSPYGDGICSQPDVSDADIRTSENQTAEPQDSNADKGSRLKNRIFENIPVNCETCFSRATLLSCYVDEANNCRRIFTLGPQPGPQNQARRGFQLSIEESPSTSVEDSSSTSPAASLIEWLGSFEKQEADCPAVDEIVETA